MDGDKVSRGPGRDLRRVAPIPWRSEAAEKSITGKSITMETAAGRRRGGHRGGQAPVDERLQGRPDQDGGQAGPARRRRQPLLGGGLIAMTSPETTRSAGRRARVGPPAGISATRGCTSTATDRRPRTHDDYDNTIYWCLKTMKEYGPDDEYRRRRRLPQSARSCYEPFWTRAGGERVARSVHLNAPGMPTHPRGVSFRRDAASGSSEPTH